MSVWEEQDVLGKVEHILATVPAGVEGHHLGRPYMDGYQLAIAMQRDYPQVSEALGYPVGGAGVGTSSSLAQYLAGQLSRHIRSEGSNYPIEGAFMSHADLVSVQYRGPDGRVIESSLVDAGWDASIYRLRTVN